MAQQLTLLVTGINGAGPVAGSSDIYEVHLAVHGTPQGDGLNLTLEFNTADASNLLSAMQGNPPKPSN